MGRRCRGGRGRGGGGYRSSDHRTGRRFLLRVLEGVPRAAPRGLIPGWLPHDDAAVRLVQPNREEYTIGAQPWLGCHQFMTRRLSLAPTCFSALIFSVRRRTR